MKSGRLKSGNFKYNEESTLLSRSLLKIKHKQKTDYRKIILKFHSKNFQCLLYMGRDLTLRYMQFICYFRICLVFKSAGYENSPCEIRHSTLIRTVCQGRCCTMNSCHTPAFCFLSDASVSVFQSENGVF